MLYSTLLLVGKILEASQVNIISESWCSFLV